MDAISYRLEAFEGPLDLLLSLIHKNKMAIDDIKINIICEQYIAYIEEAQRLDMDIASEFIVMASELMLIKSKMLLPKVEEAEEDPRMALTDALIRFQQAKEAATKLTPLYSYYSARMVKDTDEITVDKSFVHDHDVSALCEAVRRIIAYSNTIRKPQSATFAPMISKPIIPVELKIRSIIKTVEKQGIASLSDLLAGEQSLPDIIASFLGVLELIKIRKLIISDYEDEDEPENAILDANTRFIINTDDSTVEENEYFSKATTMEETESIRQKQ